MTLRLGVDFLVTDMSRRYNYPKLRLSHFYSLILGLKVPKFNHFAIVSRPVVVIFIQLDKLFVSLYISQFIDL